LGREKWIAFFNFHLRNQILPREAEAKLEASEASEKSEAHPEGEE